VAQRFQRCDKVGCKKAALAAEVLMAAPHRGNTGYSVYFITASTAQRSPLFRREPMARLFLEVLFHYRDHKQYLLHEFVLMPDHFHLLISPTLSLERSLQLIKGGFSYRARKELGFTREIWEKSFYDRRVRWTEDYYNFKQYIRQNPVKEGLVAVLGDYPYSSARPEFSMDEVPQRLKPSSLTA
jgi:putative transposase